MQMIKKEKRISLLTSDKIYFHSKSVTRDKKVTITVLNDWIHQENIIVEKIYVFNTGTPKYVKQKWSELKGEVDSNIKK